MMQFGPIVTFGPIRQPIPSFAVGSTSTLPTIDRFSAGQLYNLVEFFWRSEFKYKHIPEEKIQIIIEIQQQINLFIPVKKSFG